MNNNEYDMCFRAVIEEKDRVIADLVAEVKKQKRLVEEWAEKYKRALKHADVKSDKTRF